MTADFHAQPEPATLQPGSDEQIARTFATGERCRLVVENPRGRATVQGWARPEVYVRARKQAGGSSLPRVHATRIEMQHQGDTVILRTVLDKQALFGNGGLWQHLAAEGIRALEELLCNNAPAEVEYDVYVPRSAELSLKGVSSDLFIQDIQGTVHAGTVSGECILTRAGGELKLSTVSGAIVGQELVGRLEAKSVSGSIRLVGTLNPLRASTVSGAIELAGPLASGGTYELHTVSGSATLRLPRDTAATIRAQGVSMSVQSDLPVDVRLNERRPGARRWEGRLGIGDGAGLVFHTVSGSLQLAALSEAGTAAPAPAPSAPPQAAPEPPATPDMPKEPEPPRPPIEAVAVVSPSALEPPEPSAIPAAEDELTAVETAQMQILKALERGELTVDEALRRLEALRSTG